METLLIVMTTFPDPATADRIAGALVETGLAACASRLAASRSTYRWQGKTEVADEFPLLIKTRASGYPALEKYLRDHHPYDVPEIVAWPATMALPAYAQWVNDETGGTHNA